MKHIIEPYDENLYKSIFWKFYFSGMKVGVLDIETTGLNPARNKFILGCLYDVQNHELHQVLAESRSEEAQALQEYKRLIDNLDVVITYNGRHFDIPFLQKRLQVSKEKKVEEGAAKDSKQMPYNLDLYLAVKGYSPIRKLVPNLKQKTVENYMGFWSNRTDEISGAESVELYDHYEATGDAQAEQKILLHNNDDVRQLTRLTKIITKCDFHQAMFALGFPVKQTLRYNDKEEKKILLIVKQITFDRDELRIAGTQHFDVPGREAAIEYRGFSFGEYPAQASFRQNDTSFEFCLPVIRQAGLTLVDVKATGMEEGEFTKYPTYGSGFLVLEDQNGIRYMELNRFIIAYIKHFLKKEMLESG